MASDDLVRVEIALRELEFSAKSLRKAVDKMLDPKQPTPRSHEDCSGLLNALNSATQVAAAAAAAKASAIQVSDAADAAVYAAGQLWFNCEFHGG